MAARGSRLFLVLFLAASSPMMQIPSPCRADEEREEPERPPENSIHAGATSIQFLTFGGGYSSPFRTGGVYLKTHFSDRGALRVGTDFSFNESHGDSPSQLSPYARNSEGHSVIVSASIDEYVDDTGPVTVLLGFGPYWSRYRSSSDLIQYQPYNSTYYIYSYTEEFRSWELGGTAAAGFEWFFKRKLSVVGRVGASFGFGRAHRGSTHTSGPVSSPTTEVIELNSKTASASSSAASIGFGPYF